MHTFEATHMDIRLDGTVLTTEEGEKYLVLPSDISVQMEDDDGDVHDIDIDALCRAYRRQQGWS